MNEVEKYLRESGKWNVRIPTDWRGRAVQGNWFPNYYSAWLDDHQHLRDGGQRIDPASWAPSDDGKVWWITETADWDREWFRRQGVKPPKLFGEKSRTYWKDYGGGLRRLSYR